MAIALVIPKVFDATGEAVDGRLYAGDMNSLWNALKVVADATDAAAAADPTPVGLIAAWPGDVSTIPDKWLLCDGSSVLRSTYAALFAEIGDNYRAHADGTHFYLPDFKGRTIYGLGTHADVDALSDNEGATIGNRTPRHNTTNALTLPNHSHGHSLTLPNHAHANTLALPNHIHSHTLTLPDHVHAHTLALPDHAHSTSIDYYRSNGAGDDATKPARNTDIDLFTTIPSLSGNPTTNPAITGAVGNPSTHPSPDGAIGNPTTNPGLGGAVGNPTTNPAIGGTVDNPTTNPAIGGTIGSGGALPSDMSGYGVANWIIKAL